MTRKPLRLLLAEGTKGLDLKSLSSTKFEQLALLLSDHWNVTADEIGIKLLASQKNFGNRISEATRSPIKFLVLVTEAEVDREAVKCAIEARALRQVPTILVIRQGDECSVACCFLPKLASNPFEDGLTAIRLSRGTAISHPPEVINEIRSDISSLSGAPIETDIGAALSRPGRDATALVVKVVTDAKNLNNRISEALGRRPAVCAISVPGELAARADKAIRELSPTSPDTRVFLLSAGSEILEVQDISGAQARHEERGAGEQGIPASGKPSATKPVPDKSPSVESLEPATEAKDYRQLQRVKQLLSNLSVVAGPNQWEERRGNDDRLLYETRTLGYIRGLLKSPSRVVIVLTGDAGHGKTHICRRLLEEGNPGDDVMERLIDDLEGHNDWQVSGASKHLRIIKDLSELNPPELRADLLEELLSQTEAHVLVCANEGPLRDVVSLRQKQLGPLMEAFSQGLEQGETFSADRPDVHVVNLNHQAAAADDGAFLKYCLDHFLNHQGAWNVCGTCKAKDLCPIVANRNDLALSKKSNAASKNHREALAELVRLVEEGGYVLTYRQTLSLVAYLITGSLSCREVENLHSRGAFQKLKEKRLLQLLFEPDLSADEREVLRLLERIGRLDPGRVALRTVDERLHSELEANGRLGSGIFGDEAKQTHKKAELKREQDSHQEQIRRARRRAWLDADDEADGISRVKRLGLRHYHLFRKLHDAPDRAVLPIIRALVRGLHTLQGAVGVDSKTSFHLVDPAFGRSGSHAAVIARSLRIRDLDLLTEANWWRRNCSNKAPSVLESVEWIDRRLVLVDRQSCEALLTLDLRAFEFVISAGEGVVMREFHSADRRRILGSLARHAEKGRNESDDIRVLLERGEGKLTVERDDTILLERTV